MNTTPRLGLKKPEDTDYYNVEDFNYNMDILDTLGGGSGGINTAAITPLVPARHMSLINANVEEES